tara:strand:+ start:13303 stop:14352 length:1050 start_codon:yes stop_codon:yes gene_type:complete
MQTHHYRYQDARATFLSLAGDAVAESRVHPLAGPDGEIAMDIAIWGDPNAKNALVLSSGTHGVEGYCGSFIQCQFLLDCLPNKLPNDLMLVMIHGVNPYGFAWQRRVNEDNIDLNRNFADHSALKNNDGYAELAEALEPEQWHEAATAEVWQAVGAAALRHEDDPSWQGAAITGGQYAHPNGLFYGGTEPAWSVQQLRALAKQYLQGKTVAWLDIHTALGPYGTAECIVEYAPDSKPLKVAQELWGDRVKNAKTNESVSADIAGSISYGMHQEIDDLVIAGLEYGTVRGRQVLEALIADQWLHRYGDLQSEQGRKIKQQMMDAFYADDPEWRSSVYGIAAELVQASLKR